MKQLKQLLIIILFTLLGAFIANLIPINIPGSVVGLVMLYVALEIKLIKLDQIKETGDWLKNNMAFLFVPLSVGLMNDFGILKANLLNLTIIMIVSTLLTMVAVLIVARNDEV